MYERLRNQIKSYPREKVIFVTTIVVTIFLALWIASRETPADAKDQNLELGLTIPKGMLVVPLELANAPALNALVSRTAVVDVFQNGERQALVENLRIIKLNAGEGPLFGALVPERLAGNLQEVFSHPRLRAAIRTLNAGPTTFHLNGSVKSLLTEVSVGD